MNVFCGVGINDIDYNLLSVNLYPNPATDYLNVNIINNSYLGNDEIALSVYNLIGEDIIRISGIHRSELANYSIPVSNVSSGIYLLTISDVNSNILYSNKIMIE